MSIDKVWVLAEVADGQPTQHQPRAAHRRRGPLGRHRRGRHAGAPTPPRSPPSSATTGPPPSTTSATSATPCPGPPVAGRHRRARRDRATGPTSILIPASYDGRDIAGRLSARLDAPVITNVVGPDRRRRRAALASTASSAAPRWPTAQVHRRARPGSSWSGPSPSRPSRPVGAPPRSSPLAVPELGATNGGQGHSPATPRSAPGPKLDEAEVVVSGGRGLGERRALRHDRGAGRAAARRRRRQPAPSSTPAGCPTRTRSARPARP